MTTDFRALCADLVRVADALDGRTPLTSNQGQALDGYSALAEFRHVADRARAALADGPAVPSALVDTHYEWELEDAAGEWQAGGSSNSQSDVEREGMRYLQTYAQDGPHKLIIRQHTTQTINEIANDH